MCPGGVRWWAQNLFQRDQRKQKNKTRQGGETRWFFEGKTIWGGETREGKKIRNRNALDWWALSQAPDRQGTRDITTKRGGAPCSKDVQRVGCVWGGMVRRWETKKAKNRFVKKNQLLGDLGVIPGVEKKCPQNKESEK